MGMGFVVIFYQTPHEQTATSGATGPVSSTAAAVSTAGAVGSVGQVVRPKLSLEMV